MKRPTINDVAERAGVSKSTVSHVLNNTRYVEEDTRKRVLQVISTLGYRPSAVARSLTTKRTNTIGVIVADATDNFFGDILRGLSSILGTTDYSIIVCNTEQRLDREEHYLNLLLQQRVDGIIAMATSQHWEVLSQAETKHLPLVFVDRMFEGMNDRPFVAVNNEVGAYIGTSHLIECGHHQIGILAGALHLSTMRERLAGFRRALRDHGLPEHEAWIIASQLTVEAGYEAARHILTQPEHPEALFLNNSLLSLGTLSALRDLRLTCPEDISLVGFDDHPWAAVSRPPLTVVRQPAYQLGRKAAELMLALLNDTPPLEQRFTYDCELIVRQSCLKTS